MFFSKKKSPAPEAKPEKHIDVFATAEDAPSPQEVALINKKTIDTYLPHAKMMPRKVDAAGNVMTGDDSIEDVKLFNYSETFLSPIVLQWFAAQTFIGYQACALLSQHWFINKACSMPARDAARHGYEITVNDGTDIDPKVLAEMARGDKHFDIKEQCIELVRKSKIFGIRVALPIVDGINYEAPFNIDGVRPGTYKGISQIDPYWITPELDAVAASNPAALNFYEPTYWRVNGKRIHRSHLIIARNGNLPDILKPQYFYGAISMPQLLCERLYAAERTANEAPLLALSKRTTIYKMTLGKALANFQKVCQKVSQWCNLWGNSGVKVIGGEEEVTQFDTSLTDFDAVIGSQFGLACAIAEVPEAKMMASSPKGGLGSEGGYDKESYNQSLESIQEHEMTPLVDRHHALMIASYIAPKFGIAPFSTEIRWNPTDSPTAEEIASLNKTKAETDAILAGTVGAIDGTDSRERLVNDKNSGYNGMPLVVPGGPGDRAHEQEVAEELLANSGPAKEDPAEKDEQAKA